MSEVLNLATALLKAQMHEATLELVTDELETLFLQLAQAESRYRNLHYRAQKAKEGQDFTTRLKDADRNVRTLRLRITRMVAELAWDTYREVGK